MTQMMLVGNPNCGKTTLFNALTGENQRVGNWSGVTVEKKTGEFLVNGQTIYVTDLPGIYSLVTSKESSAQDAIIAAQALIEHGIDVLVNVVDACHLERHLYLTSQLLELNLPLILVVNMTDIAEQRGITIDASALSEQLQCPVLMLQAHRKLGLDELKKQLQHLPDPVSSMPTLVLPALVQEAMHGLEQKLMGHHPVHFVSYIARRLLEGDTLLSSYTSDYQIQDDTVDIQMANARYDAVHRIVTLVQKKKSDASEHLTAKIDRIVLHRFWALPIFFGMMYCMFFMAIQVGGAFQDFFDISSDAIFVQGLSHVLQHVHAPAWLIALCAHGVGMGINTTLTFIPVMASMYFFLSLLEASGYMARAAFVVDKAMRWLGLPGKSFVPMIVGFGCNVPAIMAARTLDSERDRLLTVLMSPFMSCSARLAIYAVFVAAFFPEHGQNVVFSLYMIGILMAVFTGFLLRKTVLQGKTSPLILELPAYHLPSMRRLVKETGLRLRFFITRAGRFIIPVCVLLGGLNALTIHGGLSFTNASTDSVLSLIGQWLTPLFSPMGLQQDNWPATVGLLTGTLAKEVVVGSLNTLYAQMGAVSDHVPVAFELGSLLQTALWSIPDNLLQLIGLGNTHVAVSEQSFVYGMMFQHFDGQVGAYAYLLFILLYIPCVSTMAAVRQEASQRLMWFSIVWSFMIAYVTATGFYQLATITAHPLQTIEYIIAMLVIVGVAISLIRIASLAQKERYAIAHP